MDRKTIIVLGVSFLLLMVWFPLTNHLFPPKPLPEGTNAFAGATNQFTSATNQAALTDRPAVPSLGPAPAVLTPVATLPKPAGPETLLVVTNGEVRYTFTSHGGGLRSVELLGYRETVTRGRKQATVGNHATLNGAAVAPAVTLLDGTGLQGDGRFELATTTHGVRAEKTLANGVILLKEFRPLSNFLLQATVRLENRTAEPVTLPAQEWVIGSATPINRHDQGTLMGLQWYDGKGAQRIAESWFANRSLGCLPGTPRTEYLAGASNVVWAAVHNQFFTMTAMPDTPAPRVIARHLDLPAPSEAERAEDKQLVARPFVYQTALLYPGSVLPAGQSLERQFTLYTGPKEYHTLARLAADKKNSVDLIMSFDGFFGFFAKGLLLSMNGLHAMHLSYGWAIIVITVIIKILFWPLTNASTKSMKRMSALQPQMKALQEKYKDDPKKMNQKLMEFMKEHKVSPLGGCLPMLLQIPVFFGFYTMLQSAIELRGARFLWAFDLSQPDTLFLLPGLGFPVNPLPLLMGATMLWQAHLTPPSPGVDPVQQKIMKYMPLMFMVFLYNFSAGLTLYWTVQNLLTIAQMKLTKATDPTATPAHPARREAPRKRP